MLLEAIASHETRLGLGDDLPDVSTGATSIADTELGLGNAAGQVFARLHTGLGNVAENKVKFTSSSCSMVSKGTGLLYPAYLRDLLPLGVSSSTLMKIHAFGMAGSSPGRSLVSFQGTFDLLSNFFACRGNTKLFKK